MHGWFRLLLAQNSLATYLRNRPYSPVTRLIRATLRAAESFRYEYTFGYKENGEEREEVVSLDRLLCGGEHGIPAAQYARHTGDLLRPSTPLSGSPHVQFLRQYMKLGDDIFSPEIFYSTAYYRNALQCLDVVGQYFTCIREDQIERIARRFAERFSSNQPLSDVERSSHVLHHGSHFSRFGSPVLVHPIKFSRCYEIVDGHHRLAIAYVRGQSQSRVRVLDPAVVTPLQQLLLDHLWVQGRRELYQPIDSPELRDDWVLVRRCTDRFDLMRSFLERRELLPPHCKMYLDVGCNYGWFVKAFEQLGFDARGVELDWSACEIGRLVYGLRDKITRGEAVRYLRNTSGSWDVISCFSLIHHFVMGRGTVSADELLRMLDQKTRAVLFFDMGQCHEEWFRTTLAGWNAHRIQEWVKDNSSFKRVYQLGRDQDDRPPYEQNYGRTLFACMR